MLRTRTYATLALVVLTSCDSEQDTSLTSDASATETTASEAASSTTTSPSTVESNNNTANDETTQNHATADATVETPDSAGSWLDPGDPTPDASVATTDGAQDDTDAGRKISCDPRQLTCRRAAPTCDYGFVPRIVNGCYGECVAIDTCVCDGPEACPNEDRYTCNNSRQRCTPYLN